jgi:hypothetical protein
MAHLRSSKLIASLVLALFALFLGSAIASSLIKPGSMALHFGVGILTLPRMARSTILASPITSQSAGMLWMT